MTSAHVARRLWPGNKKVCLSSLDARFLSLSLSLFINSLSPQFLSFFPISFFLCLQSLSFSHHSKVFSISTTLFMIDVWYKKIIHCFSLHAFWPFPSPCFSLFPLLTHSLIFSYCLVYSLNLVLMRTWVNECSLMNGFNWRSLLFSSSKSSPLFYNYTHSFLLLHHFGIIITSFVWIKWMKNEEKNERVFYFPLLFDSKTRKWRLVTWNVEEKLKWELENEPGCTF